MKAGVVLIGHGSRREEANEEIRALARLVQNSDRCGRYEVAFMQFGSPGLPEAVAKLAAQGVERIIVMPLFLITGNHVSEDIPSDLEVIKQQYPGIEFVMARHFAAHPALVKIIQERVSEAFLAVGGTEA